MEKPFKFTLPSPNFNKNAKDAGKTRPHFLTPSGMSLLPREKQPPPMYGKHGATVPAKYLTHHGTQQQLAAEEEPPVKQYCEPCELELQSLEDLKRHRAQHEKCPVAGCVYKGHPTVMDKHINALHASGLFDKFKKLSTPEEIAAWREERKKRYPTLANVLLKQKAREQRQKRGERLEANRNRFGKVNDRQRAQSNHEEAKKEEVDKANGEGKQQNQRNNKRQRKNKRNQKPREPKERKEVEKKVEICEESKNESYVETCGGVKMFTGTGQMKNYKHFNDKKKQPIQNALFGLLGMYGSDDDSMEEQDSEDDADNDSTKTDSSPGIEDDTKEDMEANGNEDIQKNSNENLKTLNNEEIENNSVDKTEDEIKDTSFGTKSSNLNHINPEDLPILSTNAEITNEDPNDEILPAAISIKDENSSDEAPEETPIQRSTPDYVVQPEKIVPSTSNEEPLAKRSRTTEATAKTKSTLAKRRFGLDYRKGRLRKQNTMLEKLLETDIRHERNVLLQCVRYVCENNYFGVGQSSNQTKPD